ncbi:hypothetical protein IWX76_001934 [Pedobacter sp. CAN_A7]|uniref:hypothetical protein n=1 Tax=Pedobacter sp. CAN_A7 TaxID=2787722 RepID=UPI0018CA5062
MAEQITRDTEALKLFFTEDIFLVPNEVFTAPAETPDNGNSRPLEPAEATPKGAEKINYTFLGQNARRILIIVSGAEYPESTTTGAALLWNIVKAIKLDPNDVAVFNHAAYPNLSFEELQTYFQPQLLISFGIASTALKLEPQPLHVLVSLEKMNAIFSLTLQGLDEDLNSKKLLWKSLQQLSLS